MKIDENMLVKAKKSSLKKQQSMESAASGLVSQDLASLSQKNVTRNGILLLPIRVDGRIVTPEMVKQFGDSIV